MRKKIDRKKLKSYVESMELALVILGKMKFKNPTTAAAIATVSAIVMAARKTLDESEPPNLVLIEGGEKC
jgi:TRAP-type mannitol/chloroaromatic compound transport system permease large subunit